MYIKLKKFKWKKGLTVRNYNGRKIIPVWEGLLSFQHLALCTKDLSWFKKKLFFFIKIALVFEQSFLDDFDKKSKYSKSSEGLRRGQRLHIRNSFSSFKVLISFFALIWKKNLLFLFKFCWFSIKCIPRVTFNSKRNTTSWEKSPS